MPIYEYETIPTREGEATKRYEIRQCMSDEPLSTHPETGESIRRVFSTFSTSGSSSSGGDSCCGMGGGHHHGSGCGCGCGCGH
jgi:predicted nucleic acid-binding Zn ribbon protein